MDDDDVPNPRGAVVLAGGWSSRMQRDKAWLPFGPGETMLGRVVKILGRVVPRENIIIIGSSHQQLPMTEAAKVVQEPGTPTGPLGGLTIGLFDLPRHVKAAFACGCDAPLVRPELVARLLDLVENDANVDAVVPVDDQRMYPLAAAYRTHCKKPLAEAKIAGEYSLHKALRRGDLNVREIPVAELRPWDPELDSLFNCNTPEEYQQALARAGIT